MDNYNPTAGEQKMLGDFNNRMSDIDRVAQSGAGFNQLADSTDQENAEKTARWALQDQASQIGYTKGASAKPLESGLTSYMQRFGANQDLLSDINKRLKLGFADGGKIDPEALMKQMAAKYGAPTAPQPAPQQAAPQPVPQQQPQAGSLLVGATNALKNRAAQIEKATTGYAHGGEIKGPAADMAGVKAHRRATRAAEGGMIQGPGTATSDSIPAKVAETGEDILVSNGERIISAKQEILLRRIASMLGFETVDAMLEAGTGKPVGPTIRKGRRAAATGGQFGDENAETSLSPLNGQATRAGQYPSKLEQALTGAQVTPAAPNVQSGDIGPAKFSQSLQAEVQQRRGPEQATPYGNEGRSVPQPVTDAAKHPVSVPASRAAGSMLLGAEPIDNTPGHPLTTKDIANGGYIDRGAGILAQRGQNGRLNVANVDTGGLTDPGKRSMDDSASALIDQKNSTYNPAAQLERMQRLRLQSDAFDPTITDPNVRRNAQIGLGLLAGGDQASAAANLHNAQAGQANAQTSQLQQMEAMRGKLLDPRTPEDERQRLLQTTVALTGHQQRQIPYQIHDVEMPIDPNQPLLGNRREPRLFDPTKGSLTAFPQQAQSTDPMAQARAAIQRGANRDAVNQRLRQLGLPEVK